MLVTHGRRRKEVYLSHDRCYHLRSPLSFHGMQDHTCDSTHSNAKHLVQAVHRARVDAGNAPAAAAIEFRVQDQQDASEGHTHIRACLQRLLSDTLPDYGLPAVVRVKENDVENNLYFVSLPPPGSAGQDLQLVDILTAHFSSGCPRFRTLPRHVLFFVGRYPDGAFSARTRKPTRRVVNNLTIDLAPFVDDPDMTTDGVMVSKLFRMEAVLDHLGRTPQSGHNVIHIRRGC